MGMAREIISMAAQGAQRSEWIINLPLFTIAQELVHVWLGTNVLWL